MAATYPTYIDKVSSPVSKPGERPRNRCTFVTFYSFKGGVGRTRAVANTAYELAQLGYDVLVIDFDLEAPDFNSYVTSWLPAEGIKNSKGFVDLIASLRRFLTTRDPTYEFPTWQAFVSRLEGLEHSRRASLSNVRIGHIDLMTAGRQDADYPRRVANIDWSAFYEDFDGGRFIEHLRKEMSARYDFVVIDSRTGYADIAGICTIQMADILVPMFTMSRPSMSGIETVVESVRRQHSLLGRERMLRVVPLPARIDLDVRAEDRKAWMDWLCKQKVAEWMKEVEPKLTAEQGFQRIMLFYQRQFAFREEIECYLEDLTGQREPNSMQYRQLVELILRTSETPGVSPRRRPLALGSFLGTVRPTADFGEFLQVSTIAQNVDPADYSRVWRNPVERDFIEGLEPFASSERLQESVANVLFTFNRFMVDNTMDREKKTKS